jgi:hypothetical protein
LACLKAATRVAKWRAISVLGGVLDHGALEEDDPGTWEARAFGEEPEASDEGDQSHEPNTQRESESPVRAMKWGNG